jgi:hypothetical protein
MFSLPYVDIGAIENGTPIAPSTEKCLLAVEDGIGIFYSFSLLDSNSCSVVSVVGVGFDPVISVLQGNSCESLTCHAEDASALTGFSSEVVVPSLFSLVYILISAPMMSEGNYTISVIETACP